MGELADDDQHSESRLTVNFLLVEKAVVDESRQAVEYVCGLIT